MASQKLEPVAEPCSCGFRSLLLEIAETIERQCRLQDPKQGFESPGAAVVSSAIRQVTTEYRGVTTVIVEE